MLIRGRVLIVAVAVTAAACGGPAIGKRVWKTPGAEAMSPADAVYEAGVTIGELASAAGAVSSGAASTVADAEG